MPLLGVNWNFRILFSSTIRLLCLCCDAQLRCTWHLRNFWMFAFCPPPSGDLSVKELKAAMGMNILVISIAIK